MKSFTDIGDFRSEKEKRIALLESHTGLPVDLLEKLDTVNPQFSVDEPESVIEETQDFAEHLNEFINTVGSASTEALRELLMSLISVKSGGMWWNFFKVIILLILTKENFNYERLNKNLKIDKKLAGLVRQNRDLYESAMYDANMQDISNIELDKFNVNTTLEYDITFYASLRNMLQSMHKPWSNNLRAKSAYESIMEYLNIEVDRLTNAQNIHVVDSSNLTQLYNQIIRGFISPENLSPEILKHTVTDIQSLVFDLIGLLEFNRRQLYFNSSPQMNPENFITREKYLKYTDASEMMLGALSTSRLNSVLFAECTEEQLVKALNQGPAVIDKYILHLRENWHDMMRTELSHDSVMIILTLIKNLQNEFNLKIRKRLNVYITNALSYWQSVNIARRTLKGVYYKNG